MLQIFEKLKSGGLLVERSGAASANGYGMPDLENHAVMPLHEHVAIGSRWQRANDELLGSLSKLTEARYRLEMP